tara:strand:+ start:4355 stop:4687 length:333 start_codon:yes stop_codon:yes gene_type:complete
MKYFHNPRCSKSRQGLAYLSDDVEIVLYLKEEIAASVYTSMIERYDGAFLDLLRVGEKPAKGLDFSSLDIGEIAEFLCLHPIVLQRPILDDGESVIIGRPVENISRFLGN